MAGCWISILFQRKAYLAKTRVKRTVFNRVMGYGNLSNGYRPIRTRQISLRQNNEPYLIWYQYSKSPQIRNSVFANQAFRFLVHETAFQTEAGWFLKCHIKNSLILEVFYYQETFCHIISLD